MSKKEVKSSQSKEFSLYTYSISNLKGSIKVRFVYLLKGRNKQKGLVEELGGQFLVPGCFIIPLDKEKDIREVMDQWHISYKRVGKLTH